MTLNMMIVFSAFEKSNDIAFLKTHLFKQGVSKNKPMI